MKRNHSRFGYVVALAVALLWFIKECPPQVVATKHNLPPFNIRGYNVSNTPTAKIEAESQSFHDVTNSTIKTLIEASKQFRTANNSNDHQKVYTASQSLPRQQKPLQKLQGESKGTLQAYLRPESHVPVQLKGWPLAEANPGLLAKPNGRELAALSFVKEYSDIFLLTKPENELHITHQEVEPLGGTVLRFAQSYGNLEVWPGELAVHLDATGAIDLIHTTTVPTPSDIPIEPLLSAEDAISKAKASVPNGASGILKQPQLLIYAPLDKSAKLGWKTELSTDLSHQWQIVIDARSGETLEAANMCLCANVQGSGVDLLGITRPLNLYLEGSTYYLLDTSKPMYNAVVGTGYILIVDAKDATETQTVAQNGPRYFLTSTSPTSWVVPDGVSAAYNFSQVYDYYLERYGRNSYNNQGSNMMATVRIGGLANAFWNNDAKQMYFGDVDRYAASLDVIGHEMTHGVTFSIGAKGILDYHDQSGALNESFSDIFGEMVEARAKGGVPDWLMGSALNQVVRNMSNPPALNIAPGLPYPGKMSQLISTTFDAGGIHENSCIFNRVYYLIAAGLTNNLGTMNAEKVFYRCLTTKLLPQSQFIDARLGAISSAEELFGVGSAQALKVAEGFDAIELFAAPVNVSQSSTNLPSVSAPDSTMWVYYDSSISDYSLARYEAALGDGANGVRIALNAKATRPSVTGAGSVVAYVTSDNSLALLNTTGGTPITYVNGLVYTMTFSPLADHAAFVLLSGDSPTNQIILLDLVNSTSQVVNLVTPVFDSTPVANIIAAGAMAFSPDGKTLAYTAKSISVDPNGNIFTAWSIYTLDMTTLEIKALIPPNSQYQSLQPFFSRTSSRYLVFEVQIGGNSWIYTADLETGSIGYITSTTGQVARASFNGDDSAIVFTDYDASATSGASLYFQALSADKLSPTGTRSLWRHSSPAGVTYRRGPYTATNALPLITITSPADGTVYISPAAFSIGISTSDPDGTVAKVELYDGSKLVATLASPPFNGFSANNFVAGFHRYTARAYDNRGATTTSAPIRIGIKPNQPSGGFQNTGQRHFELSLPATTTGSYRLDSSTNLVNWTSVGSFESVAGAIYFSDSEATNHSRKFYRAIKLP